jgi:hypothetical protein
MTHVVRGCHKVERLVSVSGKPVCSAMGQVNRCQFLFHILVAGDRVGGAVKLLRLCSTFGKVRTDQ